jgi:hypothetical protein
MFADGGKREDLRSQAVGVREGLERKIAGLQAQVAELEGVEKKLAQGDEGESFEDYLADVALNHPDPARRFAARETLARVA